jgi:hypothetical protein
MRATGMASTLGWFLVGVLAAAVGLVALERWTSRRNEAFYGPTVL